MDTHTADNLIISRPRGPANFDLQSEFAPAGDQPTAIKELIDGTLLYSAYSEIVVDLKSPLPSAVITNASSKGEQEKADHAWAL